MRTGAIPRLPAPTSCAPLPPDHLVRRLSRRYFIVLLAIAVLIAADQAIIQPLLVQMDAYAPTINIAGRQRMLSQRVAKAALALRAGSDQSTTSVHLDELDTSLAQWTAAHRMLRFGNGAGDLRRLQSPALESAWTELDSHFAAIHQAAVQLSAHAARPATDDHASLLIAGILRHEPPFLRTMDRIVQLMEAQASAKLGRLRLLAIAIAGTILALLIVLGWTVVKPATQAISRQVDELDALVALRTQELNDALSSLQREASERQNVETRNRILAGQLAHADRVETMGHLAAGLAHELNQPLGAIANFAGASDILLSASTERVDQARLREFSQQIRLASLRAGEIVRRIRNFMRPDPGHIATVNLHSLIGEVVELCRAEAARVDAELVVEATSPPAMVRVDAIQIQQVLVNLFQNGLQALEHAPPQQQRRLVVRTSIAHRAVQVDIVDGGPGLKVDDPELLFAPFQSTKPDGLGLGLSICRSIVEHHRGTIWARSLAPHGAQFSFVLPLAACHAADTVPEPDRLCC